MSPFQGLGSFDAIIPRALPWAVLFRPFGAGVRTVWIDPDFDKYKINNPNSMRPNAIFAEYGITGSWYCERKASMKPAHTSSKPTPKIRVTMSRDTSRKRAWSGRRRP